MFTLYFRYSQTFSLKARSGYIFREYIKDYYSAGGKIVSFRMYPQGKGFTTDKHVNDDAKPCNLNIFQSISKR